MKFKRMYMKVENIEFEKLKKRKGKRKKQTKKKP